MKTEGSMKTMSWSRYHCLSWSFLRIRSNLHCAGRTRRRHTIATAADAARTIRRGAHPPAADAAGKARAASLSD
jgi:hypothetical protein